jgi:hypothetical protein
VNSERAAPPSIGHVAARTPHYLYAMLLRRVAFPDFCEPCLPSPAAKPPTGPVFFRNR